MQKTYQNFFMIIIILVIFLVSCHSDEKVTMGREIEDENNSINLSLIDGYELKQGKPLMLLLRNKSREFIVFPNDYGIKLFRYNPQTDEWDVIQNDMVYTPTDNVFLHPKGNMGEVTSIEFFSDTIQPLDKIRVVVIGNIFYSQEKIGEQVAAWLDFMLAP